MISGGGNQLYHGSSYKVSVLKPNKPRSHDEDPFTHTEGVFFTGSKKDAMIYTIARDKDHRDKGLGKALMTHIKDDVNRLIIDKPARTDLVSYYKKFGVNKTKETDDYIEMYKSFHS